MKHLKLGAEKRPSIKSTDKPTAAIAQIHLPPLEKFPSEGDEMTLYVERERKSRLQKVNVGEVYTIRLGMHNHSADTGIFTRDLVSACFIPTVVSRRHRIMAFFTQRDKFPAVFMDDMILKADIPVKLEYVKGTAALECNCSKEKISLEDDVVVLDQRMMISTNKLDDSLSECHTYTYDFITFQVKIAEDQSYYIQKEVRILEGGREKELWSNSVTAKIGDKLEFQVTFVNCDIFVPDVTIMDELPECLRFLKGEVHTYTTDGADNQVLKADEITTTGLIIEDCAPETVVIAQYIVEVADLRLPDDMDRVWDWTEIRVGPKTFEDYVEIIIE